LGWTYGRRFRYAETITMGLTALSPFIAAMFNAGIANAACYGAEFMTSLNPIRRRGARLPLR
jgi:hypothetical protein